MTRKPLGIVNKVDLSGILPLSNPIQDADLGLAHEFVFADNLLIENFHVQFLFRYNIKAKVLVEYGFLSTLRNRCRSYLPLPHFDLDVGIRLAKGTFPRSQAATFDHLYGKSTEWLAFCGLDWRGVGVYIRRWRPEVIVPIIFVASS